MVGLRGIWLRGAVRGGVAVLTVQGAIESSLNGNHLVMGTPSA